MRSTSDMAFHEGVVIKLHPSDAQKHIIAVNDNASRAVYNFLVATDRELYRLKKTALYISTVAERISYLESVISTPSAIMNALPYLYDRNVDYQAVCSAIGNYRGAWKRMREQHAGIPAFHKKGCAMSYQTCAHYRKGAECIIDGNVRLLDSHHITLPKLGRIRFDGSPDIIANFMDRKDTRIGTITIMMDAVGEYWASLQVSTDMPFHDALPETGSSVGVDLNLIELANDSDGGAFENRKYRGKSQKKLAKAQRKLSRRAEMARKEGRSLKDSKNYQKQRRKVAYLQRKTTRQRKDYLNCISWHLVKSHDLIAFEDLSVKNLLRNHCLAGAISDASWGMLVTMTRQKADTYGRKVILVLPQYTTQTCSVCGHVMKGKDSLTLSVREWTCPACGAHHVRDTNAARNILARALGSF